MKRSEINSIYREARDWFARTGWHLPPNPKWDITDFGLGDFSRCGLTLINLAEEPEYCEKLMYARVRQVTPMHTHRKKKEDIICRHGQLELELWGTVPAEEIRGHPLGLRVNGVAREGANGEVIRLNAGERITLVPGIYHSFWPAVPGTVIGEVSTANDDLHDNFFTDPAIGRYPGIEEDEPPEIRLVSE